MVHRQFFKPPQIGGQPPRQFTFDTNHVVIAGRNDQLQWPKFDGDGFAIRHFGTHRELYELILVVVNPSHFSDRHRGFDGWVRMVVD